MSLLNEAYRLRYTGESRVEAKKRKALKSLEEIISRAKHRHKVDREKAEEEFRKKPVWEVQTLNQFGEVSTVIEECDLERWREAREGQDSQWTVSWREKWLEDRGLASRFVEQTPSLDTLVRIHLDKTLGKEPVVPLTTGLLRCILDACQ